MAKQTVNLGSSANDGTGDPLRSAFDKINDNFDELYLYSTATTGNNITITGNTIATDNTNGNIILDPNGVGDIVIATGAEFQLTDHVDNGVVFSDSSGNLTMAAGFTFDGTNVATTGTIDVNSRLKFTNNIISTQTSNDPIELDPNGTGAVNIFANTNVTGGITVSGTTASTSATTGALTVAGGAGIAADLSVGDDVRLISDAAVLSFGANSEITLTHDHDVGLKLKHSATADDKPIVLTLQTGETDMAANDVIGAIRFQAPDEATGTDAILVAAAIQAVSEGDFSASANATRLEFHTGASEAAASKMTLSSAGLLTISDDFVLKDAGTIGSASDPDAIAIGADGDVTLTQDLELQHDGATLSFGTNNDVILTHVHDTGLLLNSTMALQFNDASQFINAPSATVLDITATDEIELNATLIDVNGNLDVSGGVNAGIHTFVATDAITAVEHAGRILLLGEVGGNADVVLTLPVASGTGNVYKFIVSVTMASNTYKIQCPNAANVINGTMKNMDLDGTAQTVFSTVAASDTITLNGGTQGGAVSDTLTLIDIASNLWHVEGQMRTPAGANPATPFSAAVS